MKAQAKCWHCGNIFTLNGKNANQFSMWYTYHLVRRNCMKKETDLNPIKQ